MAGINKVIIVGRLGQDPEVRYTPNGQGVANFSVATSETWIDKQSGDKQEKTEWHRIVVWGKLAELCRDYLKKGRQVYIEGKLQTRSWNDKTDVKRYATEIVAQNVQFLDTMVKNDSTTKIATNDDTNYENLNSNNENFISDEDIPF